jgi:2-polyprenyl-6-methoxyphenol hydroxylase-like FAD-dependent oxidoreductase
VPDQRSVSAPDVVVIGGGTAGAAAARLLASWGHLVVLAEREGMRPALAESLPPSCIPLLETIGVRAAVDAAGFVRGAGNTVWWGGEPMRVEPFPGGRLGYQVLRSRLEEVLRTSAEAAGAILMRPATAVRVDATADGHEVELSLPEGRRVLRAPWVLDCSGRAGIVARAYRVSPPEGVRTLALIDVWEREGGWGLPDETHTLVESAEWGWGWSVPVAPGRRYVTAMLDPGATALVREGSLAERYAELLATLPALGALVRGARGGGVPWATEATPYHSREVAPPGALLVGDAASMIDPLSSFGVKKALASAWLAAVVVHTALATPQHVEAARALYREREAAYVRSAARALGGLARDADGAGTTPFWVARAEPGGVGGEGEGEGDSAIVAALRTDAEVLAAFQQLRDRPTVQFAPADLPRVVRPVVRGNVVVPEAHVALRGVKGAVRYLRSVDLLALLEIAPRYDDVGLMYAEYCRLMGPTPPPDFMGALSVLVAKGGFVLA